MRRITLVLLSAAVMVLLAACGGGDSETPTATRVPNATTTAPTAVATSAAIPTAQATTPASGNVFDRALPFYPFELENIRYGGTFNYVNSNSLGTLDPKLNSQSIIHVGRFIFEKVVGLKANENNVLTHFEPILAESWKASDDLKTYTFIIRKGVKWHNMAPVNGRDLVASDIAFSLNRYLEKDSIYYANYSQLESITAPDAQTVVIKLKEPTAWLINDIFPTAEYIVPHELVLQEAGTIKQVAIGTGPYVLKKYTFRQGAEYVRNPDYWGKDAKGNRLPYTDEVRDFFITDTATRIAAFRSGQLDFTGANTSQIIALGRSMPSVRIARSNVTMGESFTFNTTKAPWSDVRVRRAFNMALNKDKYQETLMTPGSKWGIGGPLAWSLVSDSALTVDDFGAYHKYNPAEAKKLLIEAGFPNGEITVSSPLAWAGDSYRDRTQVAQQLWKLEGIKIELLSMDFPTFSPYYYLRSHKDMAMGFQNTGDLSLNWFAQNKFKEDASQNTSYIRDPEVQRVVKEIKVTTDPAKQRQQARFLWDFDVSGSWNIYYPTEQGYSLAAPRLKNYTLRSHDSFAGAPILPWLTDAPRTSP